MSAKDLSRYTFEYGHHFFKQSLIIHADCFEWMEHLPEESLHAIVTDPPYGVKEYDFDQRIEMAVFGVFHPLSMGINVHLCPDLLP